MRIFDPKLTGSIEFLNPVIGAGITASLFGSASYALTASYALNGGVGGGGNPGGSDGQLQYRVNSTTFGGVSTATFDGTTLRATGSFSGSLTGTASFATTASVSLNGGVTSLVGTTNEILVNGTTTAQTGQVTLSLPSSVDLGAASSFTATSLTGSITASSLQGAILNSQLQNSSVTVGTTAISLGSSATTITGIASLTTTNETSSIISASNHISGGQIVATTGFTGSISASGLKGVLLNSQLQNSSVTIGSTTVSLGGTSTTLSGLTQISTTGITGSLLSTNGVISASSFTSPSQGTLRATINGVQTDVDLALQTGDDVTFNKVTATNGLTGSLTASSLIGDIRLSAQTSGDYVQTLTQGTGVTITSATGEGSNPTIAIGQAVATTSNVQFNNLTASVVSASNHISGGQIVATTGFTGSISASGLKGVILNSQLQNSSVTIGSTAVSLGGSATTITGLTSVTSTNFVGTASYVTGSIFTSTNPVLSASYALTASFALNAGGSGGGNSFATFSVAGQNDVIAETSSDTLTLVAGTNISITTNAGADSITINSTAAGGSDFPYTGSAIISGSLIVTGSSRILADGRDGFEAFGNVNDYFEIFAQNLSNGISASSDIVAYNDQGNKTQNYVDMGINSSGISSTYSFGKANDAYVYNTGGDLFIGNSTAFYQPTRTSQSLHLFANSPGTPDLTITGSRVGIQKSASLNATLDVLGNVIISGALHLTGSQEVELKVLGDSEFTGSVKVTNGVIAQSFTGSLLGSASYALTASFALNAGGGSGAGFPYEGQAIITGSIILSSGSAIFPTLTAAESLVAGDFVNIYSGGVRKASNDDVTKPAHGFVVDAYSTSDPVTIYYSGINYALTGLTAGSVYFLSTSGGNTLTPPTAANRLNQEIGVAISTTAILVSFKVAVIT